jgi:hypothetical protein
MRYFIQINDQDFRLKGWIRENHNLINGYIYNNNDTTHQIVHKLTGLGWHVNIIGDNVIMTIDNNLVIVPNEEIGIINNGISDLQKIFSQKREKTSKKGNVDQNIGKVVISNGKVITEYFSRHSKRHKTEIISFINLVEHLIETHTILQINESLFTPKNIYNSFIQKNVVEKPGVYIWYDNKNKEVIYVGMAGKIKTSGQLTNHPISQRLQAPRIKDKTTGKEITTKNYIPAILELLDLTEIEFYILPCKENEPAAFIEAMLLYNYFKQHGVLPLLNNAY